MRYEVIDKVNVLEFTGVVLAQSSSRDYNNKSRWVEFTLYKASTGQWIVSRIGKSIVYHGRDCPVVIENRLSGVAPNTVPSTSEPCYKCKPSRLDPEGLFPETDRHRSWVCDTPGEVLSVLQQRDKNKVVYLTNVASDLLEDASKVDPDIYNNYKVRKLS